MYRPPPAADLRQLQPNATLVCKHERGNHGLSVTLGFRPVPGGIRHSHQASPTLAMGADLGGAIRRGQFPVTAGLGRSGARCFLGPGVSGSVLALGSGLRLGPVWGLGGVAYGLTLARLGMAFANSFVFGVTIVTGALIPLALNVVASPSHPLRFGAGLVLCLVATGLIGLFRGRGSQKLLMVIPESLRSYRRVVGIAIVSGLASAGYGLAFSFSFGTIHGLIAGGVSPVSASLVVVLPVYLGGASVAVPVGLFFAKRSRTLLLFIARHAA